MDSRKPDRLLRAEHANWRRAVLVRHRVFVLRGWKSIHRTFRPGTDRYKRN